MNLEIKNNREITPQKIAVKQYEADTTVLTFTRDSYKYDQIDLRNYKAYAITCINGEIDMTELTKTVSGSQLVLTWPLSARTLLHAGAIAYQISFKADKDSAAVFNTYQGIIQNSASIDESQLVGDYPTIMKQWLDLINARSGAAPHKVVYMLPGSPVPVAERVAGTLYYQWEEPATTSATAATGVVNLGSSPYADSGLYINGKHVYVDNTSDTVYVIEPSVWVDTINNADCGVIASDVSTGGTVKILLTASSAGVSGNSITYELGLAQYGAGKGQINPSGGTTQGATLTGGYDAQTGVEKPIGQFEDHFGNVLARTGAKLVPDANFDTLLEDGEYICSGSFTTPITCTYCMLRVTDSPSTSRIIQECYVVDLNDHTVRTFVRSISGSTFGAWRENSPQYTVPDYSKGVTVLNGGTQSSLTYTAPTHGTLILVPNNADEVSSTITIKVNEFTVAVYNTTDTTSSSTQPHTCTIPVAKGDVVKVTRSTGYIKYATFIPNKLVFGN